MVRRLIHNHRRHGNPSPTCRWMSPVRSSASAPRLYVTHPAWYAVPCHVVHVLWMQVTPSARTPDPQSAQVIVPPRLPCTMPASRIMHHPSRYHAPCTVHRAPCTMLRAQCTMHNVPSTMYNNHLIISSHLTSPFHLTSPHLIFCTSPHFISSHLIEPHLISSHLIAPHLISSHCTSYQLISSHLISTHAR